MGGRLRVLIAYTELLEYRVAVLERLSRHYELTVSHSGPPMTTNDCGFSEVVLPCRRLGRLRFQPSLRRLVRSGTYDAVIFFMDIAWFDILILFLFPPRRSRRITWGLWRTKSKIGNAVRLALARMADCNVFYSHGAADDFRSLGLSRDQIAVAVNSVHVRNPGRNALSVRDSILVVGSFNPRKQNDVTIAAFAAVLSRIKRPVRLVFVGSGIERSRIEGLASASSANAFIEFHDALYDDEDLRGYYDRALCSVSFGQAGLSVLQSFAFGVPFVTRVDAITGGELENIQHGQNGLLCENSQVSLETAIERLIADADFARRLGENALVHYQERASVDHMVAGFVRAIEAG